MTCLSLNAPPLLPKLLEENTAVGDLKQIGPQKIPSLPEDEDDDDDDDEEEEDEEVLLPGVLQPVPHRLLSGDRPGVENGGGEEGH